MPRASSLGVGPRWPNAAEVDLAFRGWAAAVRARHPEITRLGYFGSYATGRWGVGSDIDVVILVASSADPFPRRLLDVTDRGLPVPADLLVYTEAEWAAMRARGARLVEEVERTAVWAPEAS
ncbi:MAG: nucleotidyltransferase domain-containing protein [Deltaproteobacteria bacterium]|nr:nucleotidyltransferase domain-containing protein [Deltaproteobacteria bacterium]